MPPQPVDATPSEAAVASGIDRLVRIGARVWETLGAELDLSEVAAQALVAVGDGARTVSAVAEECGRHVSTASRMIDALVQRELVARVEDPDDRRAVRLSLTREGARVAGRVAALHERFLAACLAELEPAEVDQLGLLLGRLADAAETRIDELA